MIRPEVIALLRRWLGVIEGAVFFAWGLWLIWRGASLLPQAVGIFIGALGIGWAINAWRRMRFQSDPSAPGLIEVDEGRVRFLHPVMGGEISLNDLSELKLITLRGRLLWQMKDLSGARLVVPLDSAGAGELVDAFATLPGLSAADLVSALDAGEAPGTAARKAGGDASLPVTGLAEHLVWTRPGSGLRVH